MIERGRREATMLVGMFAAVIYFAGGIFYPLMPSGQLAAVFLIPAAFFTSMPFGVAPAAIQQMMPNAMRGQASAIYLFVINLVGLGIGPTAVALTTDYVFRDDQMVNYSLLIVNTVAHLGAALLLWAGLKHFRRSLDRLHEWNATHT